MPSITAPESAEQSATPAPASDVTQEIPAVPHVPVPADQEEDSSWASYAALGAAILMLALLWFMRRGRRNKKLEEIQERSGRTLEPGDGGAFRNPGLGGEDGRGRAESP